MAGREVVILTRGPALYSTTRLTAACQQRGLRISYMDPLRCQLRVNHRSPTILYAGQRISQRVDALIPRIGASITHHGVAVVRQWQLLGVTPLNDAEGIARSRDKLHALQILAAAGIDVPYTAYAHDRNELNRAIHHVGGPPVILKLLEGTHGVGVMLCDSMVSAESVLDAMGGLEQRVLVQEYIEESAGRDLRAIVVGDRVVAAMRRISSGGDFRSNLHQGGTAVPVTLEDDTAELAVRAARTLGLQVAGVDLLESHRGPLVLEVNSSPGLEGIERTTRVDVAGHIVELLEQLISGEVALVPDEASMPGSSPPYPRTEGLPDGAPPGQP